MTIIPLPFVAAKPVVKQCWKATGHNDSRDTTKVIRSFLLITHCFFKVHLNAKSLKFELHFLNFIVYTYSKGVYYEQKI